MFGWSRSWSAAILIRPVETQLRQITRATRTRNPEPSTNPARSTSPARSDHPRTFDQPRFNPPRASKQPRALTDVAAEARAAAGILRRSSTMTAALASPRELDRSPEADQGDAAVARRAWLVAQLDAVAARAAQQAGERIAFDQELLRLFGVARPVPPRPELSRIRNRLDRLLPGRGSAALRLAAFEERSLRCPPTGCPRCSNGRSRSVDRARCRV